MVVADPALEYQGLIHSIAKHFRPDGVLISYEDLISVGNLAVLTTLPKYDASLGNKVTTYLYPRIKNAMRDEIRKFDILSRSERREGTTVRKIYRRGANDFLTEDSTSLHSFNQVHAKHTVAFYLKNLSGKGRLVLDLYYFSGLKMKSIAYLLDLTEGRISQILQETIQKLKRKAVLVG